LNLHIIGGGAQNALLNQFTAEATGRTVLAGPIEATAIGNVLVQAVALNLIGSLAEGRAVVRDSFPVQVFVPQSPKSWDEAYQRYLTLRQAST
jgi:rhamnulokinase